MADEPPAQQPGKLTPQQIEQIQNWLRGHWTQTFCPFHGPTRWEVGDTMIQTIPFVSSGITMGGSTYPLLVVTCSVCGFTVLVNAIKVGIVVVP